MLLLFLSQLLQSVQQALALQAIVTIVSMHAGTPVAAPEKSGKKRKASLGVEGDENNGTPAKKAAKGVSHPKTVNDATQQYADALFKALSAHGKPMSMALLSQKVKKPEGAEKVGKLVTKYECFTRGTEGKAKDMVSLTETVGAKLPATV